MSDVNPLSHLLDRLIMDSSHALNKIQFERFTDKSKLNTQQELSIRLKLDKGNGTLSIIDTGTGMTKADLEAIGRSGNKEFKQALQAGSDNITIIDQLSASLYVAYLVVDKVIVTTKHNDEDQYTWEPHAGGFFSITRDVNGEQLGRGTEITLFLKKDQLEYLEESKIQDLVKKYSEFISYPIYHWTEKAPELDEAEKEKEEGDVVKVSYEWRLISEQKRSGPRENHQMQVGPTASYWVLCKTIKDILGDKVVKVTVSFGDSSSCRLTRKRILEINPDNDIVQHLKKMAETGQNEESVKVVVQLLFETALSAKKKKAQLWKKLSKALNVSCSIMQIIAAVLSFAA